MNLPFFQAHNSGTLIAIRVTPKSSSNKISGRHGDELKILIKAPPIDGQANKELIRFLARTLGVRKSDVELVSGEASRSKKVFVNCPVQTCIDKLNLQ